MTENVPFLFGPPEDIDCSLPEATPEFDAEVFCDGASLGNPGHAGVGVVIRTADGSCADHTISEYIGVATNNVAEYSALVRGLKQALSLGFRTVAVYLDSELLVKQLNGDYRVRSEPLKPFWQEAVSLLRRFDRSSVQHIRRDKNRHADALAKASARKTK